MGKQSKQISAMKKVLFLAATMLPMAFTVSCEKCDTADSNTALEEKNISKITFDMLEVAIAMDDENCESSLVTTSFKYDESGRILDVASGDTTIIDGDTTSLWGSNYAMFAYAADEIKVVNNFTYGDDMKSTSYITYALEDGAITTKSQEDYEDVDYAYNEDGKLIQCGNKIYEWDGENITKITSGDMVIEYKYSETNNFSNIDLNEVLTSQAFCDDFATLARLLNSSSEKLISECSYYYDGYRDGTFSFEYDNLIYPTLITMTITMNGNVWTTPITIEY